MDKKKLKKIQQNFSQILKDFKPNLNYREVWTDLDDGRKVLKRYPFELPREQKVRYPFIIYLLFKEGLNYPVLPRFEKVAWEIPILYKNHEFILAHRKFGFDISAYKESDELHQLAIEAIEKMNKATPLIEALVNSKIQEKVESGKITLENKYSQIRNRYIFFREKLESPENAESIKLKEKLKNLSWNNFKNAKEAEDKFNEIKRLKSSNSYYLYAMIDSYFSLMEHITVLLIPFLSHIKMDNMSLEDFIGKNWKDKLQIILEHKENKVANKKIEILDEIKQQIRNPMSHGYFHKGGKSFFIHMDGLGAIPFTLTKSATKYKFSDVSSSYMPYQTIIKHFDDFEEHLDSDFTKNGMMYIKRDLPVAFDKTSSTKYRRRMRTEKSTERYIKETINELENAINMDW
tara:strand:+ start:5943 stop:7154 length:1212 start_codon:yes stop_codon:yes gene_type:complete